MRKIKSIIRGNGDFHLEKWFLDLVLENGDAMIFYAAKLRWKRWTVPYTSWLYHHHTPTPKVKLRSRFRGVNMPLKEEKLIKWEDEKFDVSGEWHAIADPIEARLFDSVDGHLDWQCFQPASEVELKIGNRYLKGRGYAERLILTAPPWKIPMNELRWGRLGSEKDYLVWVEIKEKERQKWLWWNGERIHNCTIGDSCISLPDKGLTIQFDRGTELEGEKKIFKVVEDLVKLIPRFDKAIPLKFLMADEHKWLSKAKLLLNGHIELNGHAIHELVEFKNRNR